MPAGIVHGVLGLIGRHLRGKGRKRRSRLLTCSLLWCCSVGFCGHCCWVSLPMIVPAPGVQPEEHLDHVPVIVLSTGQGRWNTGVWTGFGDKQPTLNWAAAGVVVDKSSCRCVCRLCWAPRLWTHPPTLASYPPPAHRPPWAHEFSTRTLSVCSSHGLGCAVSWPVSGLNAISRTTKASW